MPTAADASKKVTEISPLLPRTKSASLKTNSDTADRKKWIAICLLACVWVVVGVALLVHSEGFTVLEAAYVTTQIVTTIGYGDFSVGDNTKAFLCFYVLGGLVVAAYVINTLVEHIANASTTFFRRKMLQVQAVVTGESDEETIKKTTGDFNDLASSAFFFLVFILAGASYFVWVEGGCSCVAGVAKTIDGCEEGPKCLETKGETLQFWEAVYMSIITLTTVGFGDHSPKSELGRSFGIPWMLIGVGAAANFIRACTSFFLELSSERKYLMDKTITKDLFEKMDVDGNGSISRAEFRRFLLLEFRLVDPEILDMMDEQYDALDPDSTNSVTFEAISNMYAKADAVEAMKSSSLRSTIVRASVKIAPPEPNESV